jgi:hypothetical protein
LYYVNFSSNLMLSYYSSNLMLSYYSSNLMLSYYSSNLMLSYFSSNLIWSSSGQVLAMDEAVGQIVAELERRHLLEDTIIVFTSDVSQYRCWTN